MAKISTGDLFLLDRNGQTYKANYDELKSSIYEDAEYFFKTVIVNAELNAVEELTINDDTNVGQYSAANDVKLTGGTGSGATISYTNDGGFVFTLEDGGTGYTLGDELTIPNGSANVVDGLTSITSVAVFENDDLGDPIEVGSILSAGYYTFLDNGVSKDSVANTEASGLKVRVTGYNSAQKTISSLEIESSGYNYTAGDKLLVSGGMLAGLPSDQTNGIVLTINSVNTGIVTLQVTEINENSEVGSAVVELHKPTQAGSSEIIDIFKLVPEGSVNFEQSVDHTGAIDEKSIKVVVPESDGIIDLPEIDADLLSQLVIISSDAPQTDNFNNPVLPGLLWYNTRDGRMYVAYAGGGSVNWVDASPSYMNEDKFVKTIGDEAISGSLTIGRNSTGDGGTISAYHFNIEALSPLP